MKKTCLVILLLALFGCVGKKQHENSALFSNYIQSFSGGSLSVAAPIVVRFKKEIDSTLQPDKILTINPSVKGSIDWKEKNTLLFVPESNLDQDQTYTVKINLKRLFSDVKSEEETFHFEFKTLKQNFEVTTEEIRFSDPNNPSNASLSGHVQTADVTSLEAVKKAVFAKQNKNKLNIVWKTPKSKTLYEFDIDGIKAGSESSSITINVEGNHFNTNKKESISIAVPSTNIFKVLSSKIISNKDNYISVIFSNPLDENQNLKGYLKIGTIDYKGIIDGNELKIYLGKDISKDIRLNIYRRIRNTSGASLKENYEVVLPFIKTKPEVRISISEDKVILPASDSFIIPFEAIGLKAVEVSVVKVFTNNALQYLQQNKIGGKRQLNRVARPIIEKTIDLSALGVTNFHKWNTYSLDLTDFLQLDPGALYQVRVGFKRKHAVYGCNDDNELFEELPDYDWTGDISENSNWDSYENYYNSNFNWEERDNPCDDSYYGERRSVNKIFLASDLGIIAKRSDYGDLSVFVSSLLNASPIKDVEISVYDYQQQLIGKSQTDDEGNVKIKISKVKPFALIAKKGSQRGYLKLDNFSSLSLSNFDISGTKVRQGLKGFIYGERGVWRPSDTIHLTFVLQDLKKNFPKGHPVVMELYDPSNRLAYRKINRSPLGNMFMFNFVTDKEAPTGNWNAKVRLGAVTFDKKIRIETVKPNRLKINLNPLKKKITHLDRSFEGLMNVSWLTGAKARDLKVQYEMMLKPIKTVFKGYPNFVFDNHSRDVISQRNMVFQGKLDNQGNTAIKFDLGDNSKASGALKMLLFGKVFEEGGDFSVNKVEIPYYPFESFVGLKVPVGDKRGMLLTDKKHKLHIATLDSNGKPIPKKNIKISLYKLKWKWWWDKSYENLSSYIGKSYLRPAYSFTTSTQKGIGFCEIEVKKNDWGRYFIIVEDTASGHSAGQVAYFDWPGWAGKQKNGQLDGASMLDFTIQKEKFNVGEEITLTIPSTIGNRILVSLETGKEVLKAFWVDSDEKRTQIKFKATKEMSPNVYAHLTMIQPHSQNKNDLPIRLYGIKNIKIIDSETQLNPIIELPKSLRPEQSFTVKVSEKQGKAMNYTLAVVDEGLLDLTNYETPNIWESFYNREALSVKTWDLYDNVMNAFATKNTFMTTIGGDAELIVNDEKTANRFKPVVKFFGPFSLKKGKQKSHKISLPQYLGSVRTMVVAANDIAYGSTEKTTPVKQDLMVLATVPRVIGPNEVLKLPVNIFALSENIKNATVTLEVSGAIKSIGATRKTIKFSSTGDQMVYFDVKALKTLGVGKIKVNASSGKTNANYDIEINVIPRNPIISEVASSQTVTSSKPWEYHYAPLGLEGKNEAVIEISALPPLNLEDRMNYLIRYPHGCVEQITSSVFPQLYLNVLASLSNEKKEKIQQNITDAIFRLRRFQTSEGGFGYWPGNHISSEWGSNYVGHFMFEAKNLGYAVPETLIKSWVNYQISKANSWTLSVESSGLTQAYRLYTLALAKRPLLGAMNRLKEEDRISEVAKWRLALAYAITGFEFQAEEIIKNIGVNTTKDSNQSHYRQTFGSDLRDRAMILETLSVLSDKEKAYSQLEFVAKEFGNKKWMSTQTTAYSLLAIAKFLKLNSIDNKVNATLTIGKNEQIINSSEKYLCQITLKEPEKEVKLSVKKLDSTAIFVRLIKKGIPLIISKNDSRSNINFRLEYEDLLGNPIDITRLAKGTNFYARVTVSNPGQRGTYSEMALTQIFPSGWEIINTRLDETEINDESLTYKDIRDDRVLHYFDLKPKQEAEFVVLLNAAYEGKYYMPLTRVEAMYDNSIYGNKSGKWVSVVSESN